MPAISSQDCHIGTLLVSNLTRGNRENRSGLHVGADLNRFTTYAPYRHSLLRARHEWLHASKSTVVLVA